MQVPAGSAQRQHIEADFLFSVHQVQRCWRKSRVFSPFLKIERNSADQMKFGNSFGHHQVGGSCYSCCFVSKCQGFEFDETGNQGSDMNRGVMCCFGLVEDQL